MDIRPVDLQRSYDEFCREKNLDKKYYFYMSNHGPEVSKGGIPIVGAVQATFSICYALRANFPMRRSSRT